MNSKKFKITLENTLNRSITFPVFIKNTVINFAIMFNTKSSALATQYDSSEKLIRDKVVTVRLHRNLNNCMFSKTFFNLESIEDDNKDFRCMFKGINSKYEQYILNFCSEKYDLRYMDNESQRDSNYILIKGWKFYNLGDDLFFYFVQRKYLDKILRLNVIRTMGIQFSTEKGFKVLNDYYQDFNKK